MHLSTDTIVAIATPAGTGPIGVVRLSGDFAKGILKGLWTSTAHNVDNFVTHRFYYGKIADLSTENAPPFVDEVMAVWFERPVSYTGEEMVEVYSHGSPYILKKILTFCCRLGARLAEPGEFTQRAFLSGRIDLAQAEAVADLIASSGEASHRCAVEQLKGVFSRAVKEILDALVEVRSFVEASIDFPEEDIELLSKSGVHARLMALCESLEKLSSTYREGRIYRDGLRVAIVGRPNAGKSSLLNAMLGEDRAIVHHEPGTTRDVIEESVVVEGIALRLVDTAGLRPSASATRRGGSASGGNGSVAEDADKDDVETLGVERSRRAIGLADVIVVVIDGSVPTRLFSEDLADKRVIVAINKCDLVTVVDPAEISTIFSNPPTVKISALKLHGLEELKREIVKIAIGTSSNNIARDCPVVTNLRHKEAIDRAVVCMGDATKAVEQRLSAEFVAEHLRYATDSLGAVVGTVTNEDLLREIFGRFCIGK